MLSFGHRKGNVSEKLQATNGLCQVLYVKKWIQYYVALVVCVSERVGTSKVGDPLLLSHFSALGAVAVLLLDDIIVLNAARGFLHNCLQGAQTVTYAGSESHKVVCMYA